MIRNSKRPTMADVAAKAGVDRAVVSRVLNEDATLKIREATRARVMAAVAELGYQPNAIARSLRTARTSTFGLVIPDFANPIWAKIVTAIEEEADHHDLLLVTGSARPGSGRAEHFLGLLQAGRIDGLLVAAPVAATLLPPSAERLPWLSLNQRIPGHDRYVLLDDPAAVALAVDHLVALGHRDIAHIAGPDTLDSARRRLAGFKDAMSSRRLTPCAIVSGSYTTDGGEQAMRELLAQPNRPSAVVVANVASAAGALNGARAAGVRVPREISVIAIHDLPLAHCFEPPLTTVRMPLAELGREALRALMNTTPEQDVTAVISEPIEIITRASTAPPRT
ncbi:LacI family DNA-binding transcriptional regulator [Amycolatopsis carbonis]|uniref:LacI family DNA-binding transcriptional regulator n=1 Tax=Amycolatopsis carbonis TaxID=715471 RepID=A0A9Y2IMZ8_9PSEU|nr:LacI family DNA-binding transcriptional regulator [Amycolatopsis sp. 2-15]WIX83330.1 LacI family DNA-binding transcriptional regulator [Amycolatopsis sp. 2-15]